MAATDMIRLSLDVSPEANTILESVASNQRTTKSDVLRKAISLIWVADEAKRKNRKVGVLDGDSNVFSEIVGL